MQGKRMVAIGHSAGARTMLLSIRDTAIHSLPYVAFVLVEPALAKQTMLAEYVAKKGSALVAGTKVRQDRWPDRSEAKAFFAHLSPWKTWDGRILEIYVDSGLEESDSSGEVTLKCDRRQETMAYQDVEPDFAEEELERVCGNVPVHFVWATKSGLIHKKVQESFSDTAASITHVRGGHLLLQENPDGITSALCSVFDDIADLGALRAKCHL